MQELILVVRLRMRNDAQAEVTPMKIILNSRAKSAEVNVQRYPTEQRKFMDTYFSKLV